MQILLEPYNFPFTVALGLMALGTLMQLFAAGMGEVADFFHGVAPDIHLDAHLPEVHTPEVHLPDAHFPDVHLADAHLGDVHVGDVHTGDLHTADVSVGGVSPLMNALDWLGVGRLPLFIFLSLFFALFGLVGLTLQGQFVARTHAPLPILLASAFAFVATIPLLKISGMVLQPILPRDETEAVSSDSFLGLQAVIDGGVAAKGRPAKARLQDRYGHYHYVLVEPENPADKFETGTPVLLVRRREYLFYVLPGVTETV